MGSNVVDKKLCYAGNLLVLCCSDGNIPILTNIKAFVYHIVTRVVREQSVGDAYTQTAFDHGKKRVVAADLIMQVRFVGNLVQEAGYFKVVFFVKLNKGGAV